MDKTILGGVTCTPMKGNNTITVDGALSKTSKNPVQNMVVTEEFAKVNTTVGNINALLETI